MSKLFLWIVIVLLSSLHCITQTYGQGACPYPISVLNGDFENDNFSPWELDSNTAQNISLQSPGYKSKYALRIDSLRLPNPQFAETIITQTTASKVCYGYYYNISLAYNWLHYVGPPAPGDKSVDCGFTLSAAFGSKNISMPPSRTHGWRTASSILRDTRSHYEDEYNTVEIQTYCFVLPPNKNDIPQFSLLLDNVKIAAVNRPPTPPLPTDPATCSGCG